MSYLIIVIVLLIMLSPVFWMMPSPKQKREMQLRQKAMTVGFQVKVVNLPQTHKQQIRQEPVRQGVVYRLPWTAKIAADYDFPAMLIRAELPNSNTLDNNLHQSLLLKALNALPDCVDAIECTVSGIAIYWRERGDVDLVDDMYNQLNEFRSVLQSHMQ